MKKRLIILILAAIGIPLLAATSEDIVYGPITIMSSPRQNGHPGTPFSVVRVLDEPGAPASIARLSLRGQSDAGFPLTAQPGFGPCLTFQARLEAFGPDVDLAHFCVRLNSSRGAELTILLRGSDGQYRQVLKLDAEP